MATRKKAGKAPRSGPTPGQPPAIRADRLRKTREDRGLTQTQLAVQAGLLQCQVSDMERGKIDVRLAAFVRLCDALGVSADYLLGRDPQ